MSALVLVLLGLLQEPGGPQAPPPSAAVIREEFRVEHLYPSFVVFGHPLLVRALELDEGQRAAADVLIDDWLVRTRALQERLAALGADERVRREELQRALVRERYELELACRPLLSAPQRARLREIALQLSGLRVFRDRELVVALGLSEAQLESIQLEVARVVERTALLTARHRAGELTSAALEAERRRGLELALARALSTLQSEQRAQLLRLQGEPVGFAREELVLNLAAPAAR